MIRVSSDPSKMWDRARRSLFYFSFFFFTANSPHASRGSPAPVYKGTRVLEMMASVEKKKGRGARYVLRSDTCITLFILCLRPRKYTHPPPQPSVDKKPLTSFSPFLPARATVLPLLSSSYRRNRGIYQQGPRRSDPEIHSEVLPKCAGTGRLPPRVAPTVASHKFPARPGKKNEEPSGTSFNAS